MLVTFLIHFSIVNYELRPKCSLHFSGAYQSNLCFKANNQARNHNDRLQKQFDLKILHQNLGIWVKSIYNGLMIFPKVHRQLVVSK